MSWPRQTFFPVGRRRHQSSSTFGTRPVGGHACRPPCPIRPEVFEPMLLRKTRFRAECRPAHRGPACIFLPCAFSRYREAPSTCRGLCTVHYSHRCTQNCQRINTCGRLLRELLGVAAPHPRGGYMFAAGCRLQNVDNRPILMRGCCVRHDTCLEDGL